jgi:DmsE family decaheme c-type cytochrome
MPRGIGRIAGGAALVFVAAVLLSIRSLPAQAQAAVKAEVKTEAPKGHESFNTSDCATCHEKAVAVVEKTRHGHVDGQCAACHGEVTDHLKSNLEKGEPGPIIKLGSAKVEEVNKTCLGCHEKGNQANWHGGTHDRRGLACTSCHSIHDFQSDHAQLKTARDSETCFSCHPAMRSKGLRSSHHPVREGKMDCASCHNPHDSTRPKMIKADWTNELCYSCHTEKRGPFLWEHAPVRENCLNCHDPHGSNHDKLLVAKQPFLCQRCHLNTRHPGTLYDGTNTANGASVSNRAVEHACKNCHQSVHGGNAPSGPYLGR